MSRVADPQPKAPQRRHAIVDQQLQRDLARSVIAIIIMGGLIAGSVWILRPFLAAAIWATMIVVATWPILLGVQALLWGKRALAAIVMTLLLLLVFIIPLTTAIGTLVENAGRIVDWASHLSDLKLPPPPEFINRIPVIGERVAGVWRDYASKGSEELAVIVRPYAVAGTTWFAAKMGNVALASLHFLLTIVIAAILYLSGEKAARWLRRFGRRLAGGRGEQVVRLAGQAIRGVALGVVVTALTQSLLGGIGLFVARVPYAAVLTAAMFMLSIAQIGPGPVLLGAVAWLWWQGETASFIGLLIWSIGVLSLDNILRPILIRRGADLPLLLIFAGVIGGLFAFGLLGLFVGPVLLAVAYTLLDAWVSEAPDEESAAAVVVKPPPG